jgi:hypothetical protein
MPKLSIGFVASAPRELDVRKKKTEKSIKWRKVYEKKTIKNQKINKQLEKKIRSGLVFI